jgi:hypothetical protein
MRHRLRVARPVSNISRARAMYCCGLGLKVIDSFNNHQGFDGVMLGADDLDYHFEFTHFQNHPVNPCSTPEDLLVFYVPGKQEWASICDQMIKAGFSLVPSFNPYWDANGKTFQDFDGYRVVIQNSDWP